MPDAPPETPPVPTDIRQMTRAQKVAALLVILGPESAAQMMKTFADPEIEAVASEMSRLSLISKELQADILREFSGVAADASSALCGGVDYTHATLEKAVGQFKAANIVSRFTTKRKPVSSMEQIIDSDPRQVFNLLKDEQPGTIALVASYMPADKASLVLLLLRAELRDQVVERLATLAPTPIEAVEKVVEVLLRKSSGKQPRGLNQTGGLKAAAALLNALDKNTSKMLLVSLEERNPELAQQIQQKMFTFDDLAFLDSSALQRILREVDLRDLAMSLKSAGDKVKKVLLGGISKRAAETVNEEMSFMPNLKPKDVEASQNKVIEIVRRLEAEGEIDLASMKENRNATAA